MLHRIDRLLKSLEFLGLVLVALLTLLLLTASGRAIDLTTIPPSQYSSTMAAPFNQPDYYPITATVPANYRPVSDWMGRLILPSQAEYEQLKQTTQETDWAWFEVYTAPADAQNLIGKTVRLAWTADPLAQTYVRKASRDVRLAPQVEQSWNAGIIHPVRLDGRNQVGPLQSLAGNHIYDDITVALKGRFEVSPGAPSPQTQTPVVLRVDREPLQVSGRFVGLVKFLEPVPPVAPQELPPQCPGEQPCAPDVFRVQHYNPASRQFDGATETIRVPQQPENKDGFFNMTSRDLAVSPVGTAGWYIYGAPDRAGQFTVQAMQPRSLIQLSSQKTVLGFPAGLDYIGFRNWENLDAQKGSLQSVLLDPKATTPEQAQAKWQEGDRFLLIHLFGGRGGDHPNHESYVLGTYPGHFSFGTAQIVRDRFTDEPVFDIDYYQVYGNGGDGTLSGGQSWANYMGNLRRGVVFPRPISDVLVKLDPLTKDYDFGGTKLSFFRELIGELSLVAARYRIGDGTGDSTITSATSCVQDSAQAIFLTLVRFRDKVENNPQIVDWMRANPTDPTTLRFRELVGLAQDLAAQLTPMGVVRWDWQQNAEVLTGVRQDEKFISISDFQIRNLLTGLISWRTAMPRQAHDEFALLFLHHGAALDVLRTNQIGGNNPTFAPLEATLLLGAWKFPGTQVPLLAFLVIRSFGGASIPAASDWLLTLAALLGLGILVFLVRQIPALARPLQSQTFLPWQPVRPGLRQVLTLLRLLLVPALLQEYLFRVLLIPYPKPWIPEAAWWAWALLALGLFVGFQVLWAKLNPRHAKTLLTHPTFLLLVTLLGLTCTILYRLTGSLWTIALLHWAAMAIWWFLWGGWARFSRRGAVQMQDFEENRRLV
ncbi:MAG: type II CAAX prenyl endopeptidase Rce1 family protein [Elainella sp.]